ncbi:alcohol dehydrogenase [Devosia epidermidihirudinis]|uniref:enoyl-[acyl-carrier-protein] reductase n=1 Tax=Devosia epidermidihirudinis TaxID=1293439 RepID=A0A0F5Q5G4_9HYPH|nr:zinc-binding dehydrogenase [Devosia epidermidihirudinis]KKC35881.1 alcohol dehydrogenase [Devosia epidermidihirudinis]
MRSVSFSEFGDPTKVLKLAERELPRPGKGQVRIKLLLSPIHNHDLSTIEGVYGVKPALPAVPGTEAVGVVDALGEGVTHLAVGQRVMGGASEAWAEYYLGDATRQIPVPDSVDDATACQLISMPLSAKMILSDLGVKPGDWMIQNAANGAVGKLINHFAAEAGVNVINLVRRDAGVAELKAQGIGNAVSTEAADWRDQVKAITGGAPIVRGLDSLGGDGPEALLSVAAEHAEVVAFGNLTGKPITLSSAAILFKQTTVRGFWGARARIGQELVGKMIGELVTAAASGKLKLPVAAVYELADAAEAARASGEPGRKGKVALKG